MDGPVQVQVVVQGNAGAVGLIGLDTQGRVWYGELSGAKAPARYSIAAGTLRSSSTAPELADEA